MKYAFNTWCYGSFPVWVPSYTLDETIRRLARIGYDGIEIGCAAPHAWPDYLGSARRNELRSLMEGEGIAPVSLLPAPGGGPGCNPASPLAEERAFTVKHYKDVVDLAADLGASYVLYIAGWQIFGSTRLDAYRWTLDGLREIAAHAAERNVTIVIEPTSADSNLIDTADHALELMRETVGSPNVVVTRMRARIPPSALTADLELAPVASQAPISNLHQALRDDEGPEERPSKSACASGRRRDPVVTWGPGVAALFALGAWLRRRGRR